MKLPPMLATVARCLGPGLRERVLFVGGIVQTLLISDAAAGPARPTDDVDLVIAVPSRSALYELGEELRERGFAEDTEPGAPICRRIVEGVRVDVMPTDPSLLGFSNVWYESALEHAAVAQAEDVEIRFADGPHFCATKLEAFGSRGNDDFFHHDLEDVLKLVDARPELVDEIARAPEDVRGFLVAEVARLLGIDRFVECLPGHLDADAASQARLPLLRSRLETIVALRAATPKRAAGTSPAPASPVRRAAVVRPGLRLPPGAATPKVAMIELRSTNLHAAGYDGASETLTIQFRAGTTYEYYAVPRTTFEGLLAAYSHGRYHSRWIKGRYGYAKVR